ncbi:hypothetical protein [uncultured Microbacterium sp.]|uniref:hypothetical protein n=1 Tax=uncultured Microbacterium sp. TaxID=191216 RepID=UPI0028E8DA24|nr:hypothetical protein [uncultured Microbacterium sp.]
MSPWLTLAEAARRIRRWVESGDLTPFAGRFRAADILATEKKMRARRGRPRKTANRESP